MIERAWGRLRDLPVARPLIEAWVHCRRHRRHVGHWPNPLLPRSFNEHVLHSLIFRRDPLHARVSDKFELRRVVRERLGEDLCVPLLGAWEDFAGLAKAWAQLPHAFMLKPSHASGWYHAVPDRGQADRDYAVALARWWLENSFYARSREWAYRRIRPRVLAEPLLPALPGEDTPRNHRCFVFAGRMAMMRVRGLRDGQDLEVSCDAAGRVLPMRKLSGATPIDPPSAGTQGAMARLAERLAGDTPFMRVDLYLVDGHIRVSELTPFPHAGAQPFHPPAYDAWLGAVWRAAQRGAPFPPPPQPTPVGPASGTRGPGAAPGGPRAA